MAIANEPSRLNRRRIGILLICCLSLFIVGLDVTVVNVALPSIGRDLDAGISGLQWTVERLHGRDGEPADVLGLDGRPVRPPARVHRRPRPCSRLASLLCSLAPSVELLVAFRVLQAVGASMLNPVAMSIITNTFTDPRERAQAVGVWGAVFGVSMALGPIVGGALVSVGRAGGRSSGSTSRSGSPRSP